MKKHKRLLSLYVVWAFINIFCLIIGMQIADSYGVRKIAVYFFYPFNEDGVMMYDFSELFLYLGVPILIYWLYRFNNQPLKI